MQTYLSRIFDHLLQACKLCLQLARRANDAAANIVHVLAMNASPLKQLSLSCISRPQVCHLSQLCCRVIAKMQGHKALVNASLSRQAFQDHRCYCDFGFKKLLRIQVLGRYNIGVHSTRPNNA
jgi:hypothetical protein